MADVALPTEEPPYVLDAAPAPAAEDYPGFDDVAAAIVAEDAAFADVAEPPVQALPTRAYLDATVTPVLVHALEAVAAAQPADPIEFLAAYLVSNNPQRDATAPAPPGNALLCGLGRAVSAAAPTPVDAMPVPNPPATPGA